MGNSTREVQERLTGTRDQGYCMRTIFLSKAIKNAHMRQPWGFAVRYAENCKAKI